MRIKPKEPKRPWHTKQQRSEYDKRYHSPRWRKLRIYILKRDNYLCQCGNCAKLQVPRQANEVDHKKRVLDGGSFWEPANLQSMNKSCHAKKSSREGKQ